MCDRCEERMRDIVLDIGPGELTGWTCVRCGARWRIRMTRIRKRISVQFWKAGT